MSNLRIYTTTLHAFRVEKGEKVVVLLADGKKVKAKRGQWVVTDALDNSFVMLNRVFRRYAQREIA